MSNSTPGAISSDPCLGVPEQFLRQYPTIKLERAQKYYARYLSAIRSVLINRSIYDRGAVFSVSLSDLYHKCSTFNYKGIRTSIWDTFHRMCPILTVITKGNNMTHKLSEVRITEQNMNMLINTASGQDIIEVWFGSLNAETTDIQYIPIDITGLRHYIVNTQQQLEHATNTEHINKLKHSLSCAKQVEVVSTYLVDNNIVNYHCWPHASNPSPYGRVYYHGLNLQNCNRLLRRAALGQHHQYDVVAAVYAIKLLLADNVAAERNESIVGKYTNTKEYVDYKNPIRTRLATHIRAYPEPLKLVKEALTALGFGARLQSSSWVDSEYMRQYGAISTIIKNKDDCRRFIHDPWVVEFVREQQQLTDYIVSHWLTNAEFCDSIRGIPGMQTPTGKFKRNQVLCYLFQRMETEVMNALIAEQNIPVVVRIHDALITHKRLDMVELRAALRSISQHLHVEHEVISEYRTDDYDGEVAQHAQRMREEQNRARNWAIQNNKPISEHHTAKHVNKPAAQREYYDGCYSEPQLSEAAHDIIRNAQEQSKTQEILNKYAGHKYKT